MPRNPYNSIRQTFAMFGYDTSQMTDADIDRACARFTTLGPQLGVSFAEFDAGMKVLNAALRGQPLERDEDS